MGKHPCSKLAVTGMGAVTSVGVGVPAFVAALREGHSGVRRLKFPEAGTRIKSTVAADVPVEIFDPASVIDTADVGRLPRLVPMALAAAREALSQGGTRDPSRFGLILGTGAGGIDFTMDQAKEVYAHGGRGSLWTITNATHGNLAGELSIRLGLKGPSWCMSTGCASAMDALGMAMMRLRAGTEDDELDGFVVVGADAHVRWETLLGMEHLRVISTREWKPDEDPSTASRPFDRSRDGFILGEGAWAVVVEKQTSALGTRNSELTPTQSSVLNPQSSLGELLGYAATCDAYHRVRPAPEMEESARAMRLAVRDAGLEMTDVELIHYHGTATKLNDSLETAAVKLAFGDHALKLRGTSVKSMIGHPQGACGLAALVATLAGLNAPEPFIPPTINLREPDIEGGCDLDYTALRAAKLERRPHVALINCLAFGAKNSAIVVRSSPHLSAAVARRSD